MSVAFQPIEERMPCWITARALIKMCVPERVAFIANYPHKNAVGLDWRWAQQIVDFAPPEDKDATVEMVNHMISEVGAHIPPHEFARFHLEKINQVTLAHANEVLALLDRQAAYDGRPTLVELIRHHLGLERCLLVM